MNQVEVIRTLGYYQPFCSLMFHGKKETRWVRKGKKPPFPLGKYLFYSTKKKCESLLEWCGLEIMNSIRVTLDSDDSMYYNGYALGYGVLSNIRLMTKEDEAAAFVKYQGEQVRVDKNGKEHVYVQWILEFKHVERITPYPFKDGKQGVGILKQSPHPINPQP